MAIRRRIISGRWESRKGDALIDPIRSGRLALTTALATLLGALLLVLVLPTDTALWADSVRAAVRDPKIGVPVALAISVWMLFCVRMWTYRRLLRKPGPIQVLDTEVDDGHRASDDSKRNPDDPSHLARLSRKRMDIHFRERLSALRLESTSAIPPGKRTSTDFVELLESSSLDSKRPFALVGTLVRIIRPTHAYEVTATLLTRPEFPRKGVTVETVILPTRHTILRTYWHERWEDALDHGANGVAAEVVPRSTHSDVNVWASWKGRPLDERLLTLYQHAQQSRKTRRLEEALELFYETVRLDPANGYVRIALGVTQEELTLFLDALLTYRGVRELVTRAPTRLQRRAVKRSELFAQRRFALLLGFGENLAEQWLAAPAGTVSRRSYELEALRDRLRPHLVERFRAITVRSADLERLGLRDAFPDDLTRLLDSRPHLESLRLRSPRGHDGVLSRREEDDARHLRERRLHLFFQLLAESEIAMLFRDYSDRDRARFGSGLSKTSREVLTAWAALRTDRARYLLRAEVYKQTQRELHSGMSASAARKAREPWNPRAWPPSPDEIRRLWSRTDRRWFRRGVRARLDASHDFNDHYDAACVFAIPLLRGPGLNENIEPTKIDKLARAAVAELHLAARRGGSGSLAERWLWVASDDPDLAGLRPQPVFQDFERRWLPSSKPAPIRPKKIVRLNASRHSTQLLRILAEQNEHVWRARIDPEGGIEIRAALSWWYDEGWSWRLLGELAREHRHWQTRLKVIRHLEEFAERNGLTKPSVAYPNYSARPIDGDHPTVDKAAGREIHLSDVRITHLAKIVALPLGGSPPGFQEWQYFFDAMSEADDSLPDATGRALCANRASAWARVRLTLAALPSSKEVEFTRYEREFAEAFEALTAAAPPTLAERGVAPDPAH